MHYSEDIKELSPFYRMMSGEGSVKARSLVCVVLAIFAVSGALVSCGEDTPTTSPEPTVSVSSVAISGNQLTLMGNNLDIIQSAALENEGNTETISIVSNSDTTLVGTIASFSLPINKVFSLLLNTANAQTTTNIQLDLSTCSANIKGITRINDATGNFQYCDGTDWVDVSPPNIKPYGTYCGSSTSTNGVFLSGAFTGYKAAKNLCEATCGVAQAHMCTMHEMTKNASVGVTFASGGWYSSQAGSADDCVGFTTSVGTGAYWENASTDNYPSTTSCSDSRPIHCCQ